MLENYIYYIPIKFSVELKKRENRDDLHVAIDFFTNLVVYIVSRYIFFTRNKCLWNVSLKLPLF